MANPQGFGMAEEMSPLQWAQMMASLLSHLALGYSFPGRAGMPRPISDSSLCSTQSLSQIANGVGCCPSQARLGQWVGIPSERTVSCRTWITGLCLRTFNFDNA